MQYIYIVCTHISIKIGTLLPLRIACRKEDFIPLRDYNTLAPKTLQFRTKGDPAFCCHSNYFINPKNLLISDI